MYFVRNVEDNKLYLFKSYTNAITKAIDILMDKIITVYGLSKYLDYFDIQDFIDNINEIASGHYIGDWVWITFIPVEDENE